MPPAPSSLSTTYRLDSVCPIKFQLPMPGVGPTNFVSVSSRGTYRIESDHNAKLVPQRDGVRTVGRYPDPADLQSGFFFSRWLPSKPKRTVLLTGNDTTLVRRSVESDRFNRDHQGRGRFSAQAPHARHWVRRPQAELAGQPFLKASRRGKNVPTTDRTAPPCSSNSIGPKDRGSRKPAIAPRTSNGMCHARNLSRARAGPFVTQISPPSTNQKEGVGKKE